MRFGATTVALLLLALTSPVRSAPAGSGSDDLNALLTRIRHATGAPYDHHIVSTLRETDDGRTFDVRTDSDGYRLLVHRCRDVVCEGTYFDGERMFVVNINDTALPQGTENDDDLRTLRAIHTCMFTAPGFRSSGGTVVELPPVTQHGHSLRRLAVAVPGAGPLDVLIDPSTALPAATTSADGATSYEYHDYRRVDGVMLPFEIWHNGAVVDRFASRTVAHDPLVPPPGIAPQFDGPPAPIAMQRTVDNTGANHEQPVVPCTFGTIHTMCLIDSGNSALGISLELAEQLGLEPSGEFEVAGLGHYVTGLVTGGPLHVGNATFQSAKYVVLHDLHGYGYDVVLGADAFAHAHVTLDFAHRMATFAPAIADAPNATIPVHFENFVPVIGAQLGAFDATLAIDTGDEAAVNIAQTYYADHPGLFAVRGTREVSGIGGTGQQVFGEIPSVRVSTFEVVHQPIAVTNARRPTASGHLGSAFLAHFTVIFDYAQSRIGLIPQAGDLAVHAIQ